MITHTIDKMYFGYQPVAGHAEGCRFRGTNMWETTRMTRYDPFDEVSETVIRAACHECRVVHFETAKGEMSHETTDASQVGYPGRPERVRGLYLWPGPRLFYWDDHGPEAFLVTTTKTRPSARSQVLGAVGMGRGPRGGVNWRAGLGSRAPYGHVAVACDVLFGSRGAAVQWIIDNKHRLPEEET